MEQDKSALQTGSVRGVGAPVKVENDNSQFFVETVQKIIDHFNARWGQGAEVTRAEASLLAQEICDLVRTHGHREPG